MPARSARILLNLFAVAYGLVATAGPALHALPGFEHKAALSVERDADADSPALPSDAHDDCPVCHLQIQAWVDLDPGASPAVDVVAILPPAEPPLVPPCSPEPPSAPRAPPTLA